MFFSELVYRPPGGPWTPVWKPMFYIIYHKCVSVFLHRLCISKHDERAAAEAKATAVIDEDYRKLGPIK